MNFKTILIITLSVLATVVFMQNTDEVLFKILWKDVLVAKLSVMLGFLIIGFILGFIAGRPKKQKAVEQNISKDIPLEIQNEDFQTPNKNTLSDEDREYIS